VTPALEAPAHYTDLGRVGGPRPEADFGYHSVSQSERDRRHASAGGAAAHDRTHREKLHAQSREFKRNNGLYQGMLGRARQIIVGSGWQLALRPEGADPGGGIKTWCAEVERAFRAWWRMPDVRGRLSGRRLEALVVDEMLTCGDVGVGLIELDERPYLQVFEAEQIRGPGPAASLRDGVEKDKYGRPTKYYVTPYDPDSGYLQTGKQETFKPEEFLLVGWQDRASSSRPVPPCQASFPNLHRLNDVADSEAASWQIQARMAVSVNRRGGAPRVGDAGTLEGGRRGTRQGDVTDDIITETPLALIFWGEQGDEIRAMERTAPGRSFGDSWTAMVRPLGLPLGLPVELIVLDWTKSNYSQTRAVVAICQDTFLGWQTVLEDSFYAPMFAWWLEWAIRAGVVREAPGAYVADWIKPSFPWINLLEETNAWGERIERTLASFSEAVKSQNRDPDAVRAQQMADDLEAIRIAKEIEKQTGVVVPWERYAGKKAPNAPAAPVAAPDPVPPPAPADEQQPPPERKQAA
jgi:lambda family phage portal protein